MHAINTLPSLQMCIHPPAALPCPAPPASPPDEVPDGAPEIDVQLDGPSDLAAALLKTTHLPPTSDIFLQTARPDGTLRWQPLSALDSLPDASLLVAKLVRPKGMYVCSGRVIHV